MAHLEWILLRGYLNRKSKYLLFKGPTGKKMILDASDLFWFVDQSESIYSYLHEYKHDKTPYSQKIPSQTIRQIPNK